MAKSKHATAVELRREFGQLDLLTVTRNPWDRLHAHYYHALEVWNDQRFEPWQEKWKASLEPIAGCGSFPQFVRYWISSRARCSWCYYCCDAAGNLLIDAALRFAHLEADWRAWGKSRGFDVPLSHVNQCRARPDYRREYGAWMIEAVGQFCKVEIELFGHTFAGDIRAGRLLDAIREV